MLAVQSITSGEWDGDLLVLDSGGWVDIDFWFFG